MIIEPLSRPVKTTPEGALFSASGLSLTAFLRYWDVRLTATCLGPVDGIPIAVRCPIRRRGALIEEEHGSQCPPSGQCRSRADRGGGRALRPRRGTRADSGP